MIKFIVLLFTFLLVLPSFGTCVSDCKIPPLPCSLVQGMDGPRSADFSSCLLLLVLQIWFLSPSCRFYNVSSMVIVFYVDGLAAQVSGFVGVGHGL